uniref:Uncharacterized protein LOC114912805 n=1 Tax=Elaeis guineensis var. tenera TaxID=51953 RepID=A0A8N4EXL1_ELAGV|nr:uncharacterized protein LOC114912805 [Elaeis guineensis]
MKTIILSWLLLVLLIQPRWCSAIKITLSKESGLHQLGQQPQGQRLQGPNKITELSKVRRGRECEELGAQRKVSHKGEGGPAGAGGGEARKVPGGANSDYHETKRGHRSAAPQMQVLYTSHLSTIPSIWLILVLLFY